jgi:hypothetical protein
MMFRTQLPIQAAKVGIKHAEGLFLMGSCFSDRMAQRLRGLKFRVCANPFGTVYNPVSMGWALGALADDAGDAFIGEVFEHQGVWRSWNMHSSMGGPDKDTSVAGMRLAFEGARQALMQADHLLLTAGTAQVACWEGRVVANNHKMAGGRFTYRLLTVAEVVESWEGLLDCWLGARAGRQVILTVSPVRHLGNGLVANQRSKSVLHLAVDALTSNNSGIHYFPAYELLMDDLRDYRFYADDLIHPSELAVRYLWNAFESSFFDEKTKALNKEIEGMQQALSHRPLHAESAAHREFLVRQFVAVEQIAAANPQLNFEAELAALRAMKVR